MIFIIIKIQDVVENLGPHLDDLQPANYIEHVLEPDNEEERQGYYAELAENNVDEMREQRNANELQMAQALAAMNLNVQDEPLDEDEILVNSRIKHVKIVQQFIK